MERRRIEGAQEGVASIAQRRYTRSDKRACVLDRRTGMASREVLPSEERLKLRGADE